jgi:hypothetical protein
VFGDSEKLWVTEWQSEPHGQEELADAANGMDGPNSLLMPRSFCKIPFPLASMQDSTDAIPGVVWMAKFVLRHHQCAGYGV